MSLETGVGNWAEGWAAVVIFLISDNDPVDVEGDGKGKGKGEHRRKDIHKDVGKDNNSRGNHGDDGCVVVGRCCKQFV